MILLGAFVRSTHNLASLLSKCASRAWYHIATNGAALGYDRPPHRHGALRLRIR